MRVDHGITFGCSSRHLASNAVLGTDRRLNEIFDSLLSKIGERDIKENCYIVSVYAGEEKSKSRSLVKIDLKQYTVGSQINVYVPNKYEASNDYKGPSIQNDKQKRRINVSAIWDEGYQNLVCLTNADCLPHNLTIFLSKSIVPYYEIVTA